MRRRQLLAVGAATTAVLAGCARRDVRDIIDDRDDNGEDPIHEGYETTEVRVLTTRRGQFGPVTAAIADTTDLRYTGLSDTERLPEYRGMLFVYDEVRDLNFYMRGMEFGLDIVYADDEGVITDIQSAPAPGPDEDGSNQYYPGRGQYVLEVNRGWMAERDVTAGDRLSFTLDGQTVGARQSDTG
jgi:uncharacterized membrane protein (UPF0127 family)